jgi:hypothetical protein
MVVCVTITIDASVLCGGNCPGMSFRPTGEIPEAALLMARWLVIPKFGLNFRQPALQSLSLSRDFSTSGLETYPELGKWMT